MFSCDLSGKVAVVTGGNRGIGYAISKGLGCAGATVVIANRDLEAGRRAAESLRQSGIDCAAIRTDVSNVASIGSMVAEVMGRYSKIDILVNNAGVLVKKPSSEVTEDEFDTVLNTNLRGLFFCCQIAGNEMMKRNKGRIVNISSVLSQMVLPERAVYAASKAAISHLSRALAVEWAKYNITVNCVGPGTTITEMTKKNFEERPDELKKILQAIPTERLGYPEDYVGLVLLFASDAASFVTGQTVIADGGMSLC